MPHSTVFLANHLTSPSIWILNNTAPLWLSHTVTNTHSFTHSPYFNQNTWPLTAWPLPTYIPFSLQLGLNHITLAIKSSSYLIQASLTHEITLSLSMVTHRVQLKLTNLFFSLFKIKASITRRRRANVQQHRSAAMEIISNVRMTTTPSQIIISTRTKRTAIV